jgi:hypothetical protein
MCYVCTSFVHIVYREASLWVSISVAPPIISTNNKLLQIDTLDTVGVSNLFVFRSRKTEKKRRKKS